MYVYLRLMRQELEEEDEFIEDQDALLEEDAAVMAGAYPSDDEEIGEGEDGDMADWSDDEDVSDMDVEDFDQRAPAPMLQLVA